MALVKPNVAKTTKTEIEPEVVEMETLEKEIQTEVVETTSQEIAVQENSGLVDSAAQKEQSLGIKAILDEQADLGFEDLEISQFSFDRVKLDDGAFIRGEDQELGNSFKFIALGSRANYIIKRDNGQDSPMFYSYCKDGTTLADGGSSKEVLDEWKEEGFATPENPIIVLKYMEVMAQLVEENDELGDLVCLSVPPSSRARLGIIPTMAKMRFNANMNEVISEAIVGAKVGQGQKAFRPWNFKVVKKA